MTLRLDQEDEKQEEPKTAAAPDSFIEQQAYKARTIFVFGTVTDKMALSVSQRLIALAADSSDPITLFVSSPGGHLESGDAIHDVINFIDVPVNIVGSGWVGSAATHIYLSVPKARRFCTPNTRFLIHQPSGGMRGQASDIAIQAREIVKARERIARVIAEQTGQDIERVRSDIDRDYWMSSEEAVEYGLVSRIIKSKSELKK
jgi:ATP-dependent Clp protease protease subunit